MNKLYKTNLIIWFGSNHKSLARKVFFEVFFFWVFFFFWETVDYLSSFVPHKAMHNVHWTWNKFLEEVRGQSCVPKLNKGLIKPLPCAWIYLFVDVFRECQTSSIGLSPLTLLRFSPNYLKCCWGSLYPLVHQRWPLGLLHTGKWFPLYAVSRESACENQFLNHSPLQLWFCPQKLHLWSLQKPLAAAMPLCCDPWVCTHKHAVHLSSSAAHHNLPGLSAVLLGHVCHSVILSCHQWQIGRCYKN